MRQTMAQARHDVIRELVTAYEEAGEPIPSVGEMRRLLVPRDYNENHITIWRDYHTLGIHGSNQGGDSGSGARRGERRSLFTGQVRRYRGRAAPGRVTRWMHHNPSVGRFPRKRGDRALARSAQLAPLGTPDQARLIPRPESSGS